MSSFNAIAPASNEAAPPGADTVENDGFFPDIDLDQLRDTMRLDGTVTAVRLRNAAIAAVISVNDELQDWKAAQVAAGRAALAEIPPSIGGVGVQLSRYLDAVYRTAKADLTERYRDADNTKDGDAQADQMECTIGDHRRAARWAIRAILGLSNSTIELI